MEKNLKSDAGACPGGACSVEIAVEDMVVQKIRDRGLAGRRKYGTTMDRRDISLQGWANHAQQEMLDGALYLERVMRGMHLLEEAHRIIKAMAEVALENKCELPFEIKDWFRKYEREYNEKV